MQSLEQAIRSVNTLNRMITQTTPSSIVVPVMRQELTGSMIVYMDHDRLPVAQTYTFFGQDVTL